MYPSQVTSKIINDVLDELMSAVTKHPQWPSDPIHAFGVVQEEAGELCKAILQATYEPNKRIRIEDIRAEAVQTAAMCVRFIANMDAYCFPACSNAYQATHVNDAQQTIEGIT